MKKISKIVTFMLALSMVLSLGLVKEAKAAEVIVVECVNCDYSTTYATMQESMAVVSCPLCGSRIKSRIEELPDEITSESTNINLTNSVELVNYDTLNKVDGTDYYDDETTNIWENGEIIEEVRVTVQKESTFTITIPKEIVLDGETGTASYTVNAKGDIAGDQVLKVVPDAEFELAEAGGKASVTATVTQNDTEYTYQEMLDEGTDYPGSIAATLTAGEWAGKFAFNINFE